jgi:glycosyltransferase involved in cell wall biosynthesis
MEIEEIDIVHRYLVIVPAYNEEQSIFNVVKGIKQNISEATVLVINDGSQDDTEINAKRAGAVVINLPNNLGIGGAVQTGYMYALRKNFEFAIQVDADGQHNHEEISKLLFPLENNESDLVLGSRFVKKTNYKGAVSRRIGIVFLSMLVSLLCRQKILDVTSGFRAVNRKCIKIFAEKYSTDYPEVDSLVLIKKKGLRIKELSVKMETRAYGQSSITSLKSVYYMIKVTLTLLMKKLQ